MDKRTFDKSRERPNLAQPMENKDSTLFPDHRNLQLQNIFRECWMGALNTTESPQDDENFLTAGGNSLAAISLISKLRRLGKIDIYIRDLMSNPIYGEFRKVVLNAPNSNDVVMQNSDNRRLSSAQKRMLVMNEYAPSSTSYVESSAIATRNASYKNIEEAFEKLLTIHPQLRTEISLNHSTGEYVREINYNSKIDVDFETIQDEDDIAEYITKTIPSMNIFSSPLIKCRCLKKQFSTVIVIHIHHIIEDEVTMGGVIKNLIKILQTEEVRSAPLSYSEYVISEEQYLGSTEYTADELFWREKYQMLPPLTTLSVMPLSESTWRDTAVYKTKQKYKEFGTENIKQISQTINDLGITKFIYYLACTSLVLHRYVGVDDFVTAIPVSVRDDLHQTTDGLFVNTLPLRISINSRLTFREHISRLAENWWLAQMSRKYPLDRLAHWMLTTKKTNMSSVCSIMFNYNMNIPAEEEMHVLSKHAKMPLILNFHVNQRTGGGGIWLEWAEELLDSSIIDRMGESIVTLCSKNIPLDDRITDLDVLSPSELSLLHSFSTADSNSTNLSAEEEMHIQFERHANTFPENIAVVYDKECLTYAELNEIAARVAHCVTEKICSYVLKSNPVIVFSKKDTLFIAMLIGVWKSGGYFLPVSLSNIKVLNGLADRFSAAAVLYNCDDEDYKVLQEAKFTCPMINIQTTFKYTYDGFVWSEKAPPSHCKRTAYALRTSGTTGVPKIFTNSHQNLNTISNAWKVAYNLEDYQVNILSWFMLSFGGFICDFVRALISVPGKLVLCPDDKRLDILYIQKMIKKQTITLMDITPHFASYLIENAKTEDFSSIKVFILSSDVTHTYVFQKVKHFLRPDQRLVNTYGLTEATNDATYFEGNILPSTRSDTVPIGKPLPGVIIHVCDPRTLLPSPVGTVGEIYIGGDVIACGDVTVFALGSGRGVALKTGDLGCWLPSGNLEIMGRSDDVLKVRGFRISAIEIEEQITKRIPGIQESCVTVLAVDTPNKMQYLCAYVVADPLQCPSSNTTKQLLSNALPQYMIPDIIKFCHALPETIYGKIDKKAIRMSGVPQHHHTNRSRGGVKTKNRKDTNTLKMLKNLFAQAMEIEDIHFIKDQLTFRENGASSLILVRFYSLIIQETSFGINIADLFSYSSFLCLANYIDQNLHSTFDKKHQNEDECMQSDEIAITGLGIRLPSGIESLTQFWEVLEKGEDVVHAFPDNRSKDVKDCSSSPLTTDTYKGAFFDRIDQFDNDFFNISPHEAKFMSPEQRLFLHVATEALIEARNISEVNGSNIGVYLSTLEIGYSRLDYPDAAKCLAGLVPSMVGTRIAYQWNLKGPNMLVDTACSSGLMALKLASESIQRDECDGALVGGVNLIMYPDRMGNYGDAEIQSAGVCVSAFDENANGTVVGEGVLCLYIEKLGTAMKQGKHIYGVIKSVACSSVGRGNGITAPSATSQATSIKAALSAADLKAKDVHYVETHGSGTKLGDSIEISSLASVFNRSYKNRLKIGTSKSMFGSLDTASGLLGVMKVLATFMFNTIPPSANIETPTRKLKESCLSIVDTIENWPAESSDRRIAGINAFGLNGTSCHAIISDYTYANTKTPETNGGTFFPLFLIGKSFNHLQRQARLYNCIIYETIQKRNINTIEGLCALVAKKLQDLSNANYGHTKFRTAITVKTIEQTMRLLSIIQSSTTIEDLASISNTCDDIHITFPGMTNVTVDMKHIRSFLYNDHIDTYDIFGKNVENIIPAFGVTLSLYDESRHWLDPNDNNQ